MSGWTKFCLFTAGVVLPAGCFIVAATESPFGGEWQSGRLADKIGFLLQPPAVVPLVPFFTTFMATFAAALFVPAIGGNVFVRVGLGLGALTSAAFCFILMADEPVAAILLYPAASIALGSLVWAVGYGIERKFGGMAIGVVAVMSLVVGLSVEQGFLLILLLALGPGVALAAFGVLFFRCAFRMPGRHPVTLLQWTGALTAISAYAVAWRWAIQSALDQYARLPTTPPPDCFVCAAAAHGRRDQVRVLKAAELALMASAPRAHASLRRVYDRLGPRWAREIRGESSAAAARAALKPAEWGSRIALRVLGLRLDASPEPAARAPAAAAPCSDRAAPPPPACQS